MKGKLVVAATTKLKSGFALKFVIKIANIENLDMTVTLGLNLVKAFNNGKGIDKRLLHAAFATPNRKANDKSKDLGRELELSAKYHEQYKLFIDNQLRLMFTGDPPLPHKKKPDKYKKSKALLYQV